MRIFSCKTIESWQQMYKTRFELKVYIIVNVYAQWLICQSCLERRFTTENKRMIPNSTKNSVLNSTAAVSEQYRRKQKFCFFFESQQIKITVQAQQSTKITSSATAPKFVVMSRSHKLITLASNTTHKIVQSKQGVDPTRKFQVRFLCCTLCNWGDLVCDYLNYDNN